MAQHGFRERRSYESQLIVTIDDFMKCKGSIHATFSDFKRLLTRCHIKNFAIN